MQTTKLDAHQYIYDVSSSLEPINIGTFNLTNLQIEGIAREGNLVAIATGADPLIILDISDPVAPVEFRRMLFPGSSVESVAMDGNYIFAGLSNGKIATVDAVTGLVISEESALGNPQNMALNSNFIYASVGNGISTFERISGAFLKRIDYYSNDKIAGARLFLGKGVLYSTTDSGYLTLDLSDPANPTEHSDYAFNQFGWKEIRLNGSGLMLAATSANSTFDGPHDVDIYNVGTTGFDSIYLQTITTPDVTKSLTLYNGVAYAGGTQLNVINYLAADTGVSPPTISISSDSGLFLDEGTFATIAADVTDDVQVRNVEFYLNDNLLSKDGNYPFSYTYSVPLLADGSNSFTLSARAFDTAGNSTLSDILDLNITQDTTPPILLAAIPENESFHTSIQTLGLVPSENLDPTSVNENTFYLVNAGNDFQLGTVDDLIVDPGTVQFSSTSTVVYLNFDEPLKPGRYQINATTSVTDLIGNPIEELFQSSFLVLGVGSTDSDGDGLPDELEDELVSSQPCNVS